MDEDNEAYKRFKLIQKAAEWDETGQYVDRDSLAQPEDHAPSNNDIPGPQVRIAPSQRFPCKSAHAVPVSYRRCLCVHGVAVHCVYLQLLDGKTR